MNNMSLDKGYEIVGMKKAIKGLKTGLSDNDTHGLEKFIRQ